VLSGCCRSLRYFAYSEIFCCTELRGDRTTPHIMNFLTLSKDADPDIPILKPATTEYANYISRLRKMCARLRIGIMEALAVCA